VSWDLAPTLPGRLVTVEPLAPHHEGGLWAAASADRTVWRWMPVDAGSSPDRLHAWLEDALADETCAPFAILDATTGRPLGSTRYHTLRPEHRSIEIGWTWLERGAWGTGVNVETKLLLLRHAFERLGCRRVEFKADARNERSRGALEALGARFEGILRAHMQPEYGERDSAYYSVLDDEWPAVRAGLEARLGS
jgi:RimJ/RimL family protein N-acetyltransferase